MSLQFIFGNSGSGKSDFLYDSVLKQAKENKEQQFLIIVPGSLPCRHSGNWSRGKNSMQS